MGKGIGPPFAQTLVQAFQAEVFALLEQTPERLPALDGIGPTRTQRVITAWAAPQIIRDIRVFLPSHGVGTARAVRMYKTYGPEAMARLQEHP